MLLFDFSNSLDKAEVEFVLSFISGLKVVLGCIRTMLGLKVGRFLKIFIECRNLNFFPRESNVGSMIFDIRTLVSQINNFHWWRFYVI